jgi:hypothetical protein
MIKAKFIAISGDSFVNQIAKACDIFDDGKIVATFTNIEATFKEDEIVDFERCGKLIEVIRQYFESKQVVALVHLKCIMDGNKTIFNNAIEPYINKSVREISDGQKYTMFHGILSNLGISFELTEYMYIK